MKPPAAVWPAAAIFLWAGIAGAWTLGFRAFSEFSAAEVAPGPLPRLAPDLTWIDQDGHPDSVSAHRGEWQLLAFFYLECPLACHIARGKLAEVVDELAPRTEGKLGFVSLSFANDPIHRVAGLAKQLEAPPAWRFGVLDGGGGDEDPRLRELGALVVRRADGEYNHSTRFFLIDPRGRLVAIVPPERPDLAVFLIEEQLRTFEARLL